MASEWQRRNALIRLRRVAWAKRREPSYVVDALDAGVRQKDIAAVLGYSSDWIRTIARRERTRRAEAASE